MPDVIEALDSVLIGSKADREIYEKSLAIIEDAEARIKFRDIWHDARRSSMNDIGGNAYRAAEMLRAKEEAPADETQQAATSP